LRATTSKVVTNAMITSSHPDAKAIHSSSRRIASDSFNNALIVSALPPDTAPEAFPTPASAEPPADNLVTRHHDASR
jgi:hypothetical protein